MTVNVLVTYDSGGGNTAAMAEEVADSAHAAGAEVVVKRAEETSPDDLLAADCIMVGSPTYYGLMSAKVKDLFDRSVKVHRRLEGKVGAAFPVWGVGWPMARKPPSSPYCKPCSSTAWSCRAVPVASTMAPQRRRHPMSARGACAASWPNER